MGRGTEVESNYMGTLNARRDIWKEAHYYISARPVTGYGYGGFWTNRRLAEVTMNQGWVFGTAHSDYIDIALNLGLIGALLYCLVIFIAAIGSFNLYRKAISVGHGFSFILIIWFVANSLFSSMGIQPAIPHFLTIVVLARLSFFSNIAKRAKP